eukprot:1993959-Pleurochrysis_carterae.AAC.1
MHCIADIGQLFRVRSRERSCHACQCCWKSRSLTRSSFGPADGADEEKPGRVEDESRCKNV